MAAGYPKPSDGNWYGSVVKQMEELDRTIDYVPVVDDGIFTCLSRQLPEAPTEQALRKLISRHGITQRHRYLVGDLAKQYSEETWTTELRRLQHPHYWNESLHFVFLKIIGGFINVKLVILSDNNPPRVFGEDGQPINTESVVVGMTNDKPYLFNSSVVNYGCQGETPASYNVPTDNDWSFQDTGSDKGGNDQKFASELSELRNLEDAIFYPDRTQPQAQSGSARPPASPWLEHRLNMQAETPQFKMPCQNHPRNVTGSACIPGTQVLGPSTAPQPCNIANQQLTDTLARVRLEDSRMCGQRGQWEESSSDSDD